MAVHAKVAVVTGAKLVLSVVAEFTAATAVECMQAYHVLAVTTEHANVR